MIHKHLSHTNNTNKPTIIFLHADNVNGLGDNVIALDSLLALKRIYQARLVVFARETLQELLEGLDFVDEFSLLEGELTTAVNREKINAYNATYSPLAARQEFCASLLLQMPPSSSHALSLPISYAKDSALCYC